MPSIPPSDPFSQALASWRVNPRRNPQFRASVWSRLEVARRPSTWTKFARAHATLVSALLLGSILAGAVTGRSEARQRTQADVRAIATSYVHSLDARWMRRP